MYDNLRRILDFDDLLFESRNKEYGAYQLRKKYNSVVVTGIIIASLAVIMAVVIPFILNGHEEKVLTGSRGYVQLDMENLEPPVEEIYVPPAAPPPQSVKVDEIVKYVPPEVVDTVVPADHKLLTTDDYMNQTTSEISEITGTGDSDGNSDLAGLGGDEPYFIVEIMPTFKGGGIDKFREWVAKRTNYPQAAYEKKIRGTVFLTFIVEKDGSVSNVTVVKGVDPLLDNEALKAISESPKWTPGFQRGEPVRVRYSIPLNFMF
jgi:periplasmic protein TonB